MLNYINDCFFYFKLFIIKQSTNVHFNCTIAKNHYVMGESHRPKYWGKRYINSFAAWISKFYSPNKRCISHKKAKYSPLIEHCESKRSLPKKSKSIHPKGGPQWAKVLLLSGITRAKKIASRWTLQKVKAFTTQVSMGRLKKLTT